MSVTLRTLYPNQLYQLRVFNQSTDVEFIRYTYASGLITSSYLPATVIAILQARWDKLVDGLDSSIINTFAALLASLVHVSDSGGELFFYFGSDGVSNFVYATGLADTPGLTYNINVGIPNSIEMWLIGGVAVTAPI